MPMNELLSQLELLDQNMIQYGDNASDVEWSDFIDQRQQLIDKITECAATSPLTEAQKVRLTHIQLQEGSLKRIMEEQKEEAAGWLRQRGQAKVQRNAYDSSYASASIFMDQRK
ncbi:hypothetical protein D3C75_959390 [compost metagenome]